MIELFSQQLLTLSLSPTALPTIVELPMPMRHTEGDTFVLVCSFSAIPAPMIRWEKDGSLFLLGEGRRIINSTLVNGTGQSQLEIESLLISDAGLYNCTVSNEAGTTSRAVRLEVGGEKVNLKLTMLNMKYCFSFLPLCACATERPPPRKL